VVTRVLPPGVLPEGEVPVSSHQLALDPVPRAAGTARRFVSEHAPALPEETTGSLLLLTSELVSNAIVHARTAIDLNIVVTEQSVIVAVHDLDLATPLQAPYAAVREGGWGLELVAALADATAMNTDPNGGKTAWFRLSRGGSHPVLDGAAARADSGRRDS
jgi:two-component sensor histidine kinase